MLLFQWHLGMFAEQYLPTFRGFESHYGYYQGCEDYFDHTYEAEPVSLLTYSIVLFFQVKRKCIANPISFLFLDEMFNG